MRKRLLSILLALCMVLTLLPTSAFAADIIASGDCGTNVTYTLDSSGLLTISGTGTIGTYQTWYGGAWLDTKDQIKNIVINDGVTGIGNYAFDGCENLISVSIPDSVKSIIHPFVRCSSLQTITLTGNNDSYCVSDGVLFSYDRSQLITYPAGDKRSTYTIPSGTTIIGDAFSGCTNLSVVKLPDGMTSIPEAAFRWCDSLTSITIPESVKRIDTSAFQFCTNLESIDIPTGVTEIGNAAFANCSNITTLVIPNGVTIIPSSMVHDCSKLEHITILGQVTSIGNQAFRGTNISSIDIPDSVTAIYENAFYNCEKLTEITIPDNVSEIYEWTFAHCNSLSTITFSNNVKRIGEYAFAGCTSLSDVYYSGTESQWKQIIIGESNDPLLNANIHYNGTTSPDGPDEPDEPDEPDDEPSVQDAIKDSGTFKYLSDISDNAKYQYSYNEEWFSNSSYEYQHELTQMSLCVAMAAFGKSPADPSEDNIKDLMENLKFANPDFHYPTPTNESIGYAIGSKNIKFESGEETSLILVAVRGGGYTKEWGGNFQIGSGGTHEGFSFAAIQVREGLDDYIKRNKDKLCSDKTIWIVGYSRAAATTNLVAKQLDDGVIRGISAENVFAFCFECPQNTSIINRNEKYNNIVNIVNPIDFVTKVVMSQWGYSRYGMTYYLPSKETTKNYKTLKDNMVTSYANIIKNYGKEYADGLATMYAAEKNGQASTLDDFMDNLAEEFISPTNYFYNHEVNMMDITTKTLGKQGGLLGDPGAFVAELINIGSLLRSHPLNSANTIALFTNGYASQAHYPELCLAWLDSLNGNYSATPDDFYPEAIYRKVFVNCPVDVVVCNSDGQQVAQIENDEVQEIEDGVVAYIDDDGQKVIVLPVDEEYTVQLVATGDGTVTYTATEYNIDTGGTERVVSYHKVDVVSGNKLTGRVENLNENTSAEYPLYLNNSDKSLDATIDQRDDGVIEHNIAVTASGNGTVSGGGYYVSGEFAKINAIANAGETFLGWYIDGKLVSDELEYRFLVDASYDIVARFTTNTNQAPGGGSSSSSSTYQITAPATENGTVTVTPKSAKSGEKVTITAKPNDGYTVGSVTVTDSKGNTVAVTDNGDGTYTFTMPSSKVTVDVTFVLADEEPWVNPFIDVSESDWFYDDVAYVTQNSLMVGVGNQQFNPGGITTRGMIMTILARLDGADTSGGDPWYQPGMEWAMAEGVSDGTRPEREITREQFVTMLWRYAGEPAVTGNLSDYPDADKIHDWASDAMIWAVQNGIVYGTGGGTLDPQGNALRCQAAALLTRFCKNIVK